jgi:formate dehydrogenase accessory protein FdhD
MNELAGELLALLAAEKEMSAARAAKKLGVPQSQLRRILSYLGDSAALQGLGLVRVVEDEERLMLALTAEGRRQMQTGILPAGLSTVSALRLEHGERGESQELVAEEIAVALVYNGISHAVMMATPVDLEDFARGFSLSEGIVHNAGELLDIEVIKEAAGLSVSMRIPESRFAALKERRRTLTGRTGCGLCGVDALAQAIRPLQAVTATLTVSAGDIQRGFALLAERQALNQATGAVHAAGLLRGDTLLLREDVGRHNALDKLIGAAAVQAGEAGALLITSRASYEMVAKAAAANCPVLAAISAPTALAIELAEQAGITLIGFAREGRMTVFSHRERIH